MKSVFTVLASVVLALLATWYAIAAKPDLAYAYYWRGQAYDKQKKASSMAADFQTFLKLAPSAPEAPLVRAVLQGLR